MLMLRMRMLCCVLTAACATCADLGSPDDAYLAALTCARGDVWSHDFVPTCVSLMDADHPDMPVSRTFPLSAIQVTSKRLSCSPNGACLYSGFCACQAMSGDPETGVGHVRAGGAGESMVLISYAPEMLGQ